MAERTQDKAEEARRRILALRGPGNFARWCRTCYRIRTKAGEIVPLELNRVQRGIREAEAEEMAARGGARLYILKGRQGGVTTGEQARNLNQIWDEPNFDALTLAYSDGDTSKIFEMTRRAIQHFPASLLPVIGGKDSNEVSFTARDSHFWTGTAGAKRTGRGLTLKRVHGSEFAHWVDPEGTLKALTPALVPRGSAIVLETTASGYDSEAHKFWKKAVAGKSSYRPLFYPWWECDEVNYRLPLLRDDELGGLEAEEISLRKRAGLTLEQIKWRRQMIGDMGRSSFLGEYAEDADSCWLATGLLFYDSAILKQLLDRAPEPIATEYGGSLEIFGRLQEGETVMRGVDTAEGVGGDRSAFVDRAFPSWRLLAVFGDSRIAPKEFAELLNKTAQAYSAECFQVVEKNAHGITVLRELRDTHSYPLPLLYHRAPLDEGTEEARERIGWATTGESLPLLADAGRELLGACRDGYAGVPSASAVRDAFGVRRDDRGKIKLTGKDVWVSECLAWIGRSAPQQRKARIWSSADLERQERAAEKTADGAPPPSPWQMPEVNWLGEAAPLE